MDYQSLLLTLAEVSVALAGFSGVVSVFGRRRTEEWDPGDRLHLSFMLETSLAALFLSILPFAMFAAELSPRSTWAIMSGIFAVFLVLVVVAGLYRYRQLPSGQRMGMGRIYGVVSTLGDLSILALQLFNALGPHEFSLYLIGLIWLLFSCALSFVQLLGFLRPT